MLYSVLIKLIVNSLLIHTSNALPPFYRISDVIENARHLFIIRLTGVFCLK